MVQLAKQLSSWKYIFQRKDLPDIKKYLCFEELNWFPGLSRISGHLVMLYLFACFILSYLMGHFLKQSFLLGAARLNIVNYKNTQYVIHSVEEVQLQ